MLAHFYQQKCGSVVRGSSRSANLVFSNLIDVLAVVIEEVRKHSILTCPPDLPASKWRAVSYTKICFLHLIHEFTVFQYVRKRSDLNMPASNWRGGKEQL